MLDINLSSAQERLNALSIDGQSGINTLIDNLNRPANYTVSTLNVGPVQPEVIVEKTLPGIVVTPITDSTVRPYQNPIKINTVKNLTDKQFKTIIIGLFSLAVILIGISIITK